MAVVQIVFNTKLSKIQNLNHAVVWSNENMWLAETPGYAFRHFIFGRSAPLVSAIHNRRMKVVCVVDRRPARGR